MKKSSHSKYISFQMATYPSLPRIILVSMGLDFVLQE